MCLKRMLAVVFILSGLALSQTPNYVKTTVYDVGQPGENLVSTSYSDGLGRAIQSKLLLEEGKDLVTSSIFYDDAGRPRYATKPYIDNVSPGSFLHHTFEQLNGIGGLLRNQYARFAATSGGNPHAYSETRYYPDPMGRVSAAGAPGQLYGLLNQNHSRIWYFGVGKISKAVDVAGGTVTFGNGFVSTVVNADILDALYDLFLTSNPFVSVDPPQRPDHFLTISRNPDGQFSQELKDAFGNVVATWAKPSDDNTHDKIIAEYEYDILGRVLEERAPKEGGNVVIDNTTYRYNTLGQVIEKKTPDGCIVDMEYYPSGQLEKSDLFLCAKWHQSTKT